MCETFLYQGSAGLRFCVELDKRIADILDFLRIHNPRGIANHFAERATVRTDDRAPAGHRFQRRQTESFVEGGINKSFGG